MDKANSKILTLSFATFAVIIGYTISLLVKIFSSTFGVVARFADNDLVRHGLPVLSGFGLFLLLQFHPQINLWANEVVTEIRKIVWPTRKDTTAMTIVVVIMVLISSFIIMTFDVLSGQAFNLLIK